MSEIKIPKNLNFSIPTLVKPKYEDVDARNEILSLMERLDERDSQINGLFGVVVALLASEGDGKIPKVREVRDQLAKQDSKAAQYVDTILNSIISQDTPIQ